MTAFFSRIFNILVLSSILLVACSSSIIAHGQTDSANQSVPAESLSSCKFTFIECEEKKPCQESFEVIGKCHPAYTDLKTVEKCLNFVDADLINDHALFSPITYAEKNVTYWNVYCGICNFEKELHRFESWNPWLSCSRNLRLSLDGGLGTVLRIIKPEPLLELKIENKTKSELVPNRTVDSTSNSNYSFDVFASPVNDSKLLNGLRIDNETKFGLISTFNDSTYYCSVLRVLPERLKNHVKNCSLWETNRSFSQADVITTVQDTIKTHFFFQNDSKNPKNLFCLASTDSEMESFCDYKNLYGETCSENIFINQTVDSICKTDGYFWSNSSKNANLTGSECSNHTSKNAIYVCGPTEARVYKKIKNIIFKIMDYVSTVLLFLYLVISTNKQNLRSLPKRIFYSYSISLWFVYLLDFILRHIKLCAIKYCVFFYFWQSHSFWILITSYDLWRIIYGSLKLKLVNVEGQTRRFLAYCFLGWGVPAIFLVGLFPTLENVQKSWTCPMVSGFQNEFECFSKCELNKYTYHFGWVSIVIFLLIAPCLLVLTCGFVCLSRRNRARSNVNRTYTVTMMKVAVMMGFHWMLLVYLTLFDSSGKFSVVYEFISSFHGSFIFFAFGLEKNTLEMFRKSMLRNSRSDEQTQGTSVTQNNQEVEMSNESAIDVKK